ncbi:MAG: M56 family metallopeptidase [Eubacteriales bacterium]|nr:M56 family metallopeptidase [Eubacteriales bacterium]
MIDILLVSLAVSVIIVCMLLLSPLFNRRYSAGWRRFVWLILAVRLCIPIRFELPSAPVHIPVRNSVVVLPTADAPIEIVSETEAAPNPAQEAQIADESTQTQDQNNDAATSIKLENIIFAIWAAGAVLFLGVHFGSYILFKLRVRPYCRRIETNIYRCNRIEHPMMIGFFRPTILLPETDYSDAELDVILTHEMTHFQRHDTWYKLVLLIANAMHWFNPLVYVMANCADRDLEYSCDDIVVRDKDATFRKQYSMVILKTMGGRQNDELC